MDGDTVQVASVMLLIAGEVAVNLKDGSFENIEMMVVKDPPPTVNGRVVFFGTNPPPLQVQGAIKLAVAQLLALHLSAHLQKAPEAQKPEPVLLQKEGKA